jgi:hypothetical protein
MCCRDIGYIAGQTPDAQYCCVICMSNVGSFVGHTHNSADANFEGLHRAASAVIADRMYYDKKRREGKD